jgi:outer membrane protein OmpA-like peptidoglycan-associated protein
VRIDTFTDISGSPEKNVMHSEERAQSIARYLLNSGVAAESISLRGYGGAYPVASNEVAEGRTLNRRVVITISKIPVPAPQSAV